MATTRHTVLGIMSGSSLDGLDLAVCDFTLSPGDPRPVREWSVKAAITDPYPDAWSDRLRSSGTLSAPDLWQLHAELGRYVGQRAAAFLGEYSSIYPLLVGYHGHTVFHEPAAGYTLQLGDGAQLAAAVELPVVAELRGSDIAAGGQGAPLAPVADRHLFPHHSIFLNLGGIANFSLRRPDDGLIAGDVTGCCQILDRLARERGHAYDADGALARSGTFLPELAERADALPYHARPYPKSLSNQWVVDTLWPLFRDHPAATEDRLATFTRWMAGRIAGDLTTQVRAGQEAGKEGQVLVTGGGARNGFLIECLGARAPDLRFVTADDKTGDFKEAALVALCALFRREGIPNSLAAATGAARDTINGALYAG
ncbi:anhydro-N-acetylmuramic acid kinase [Lewinella sp. JB7]|uniref:anhydro-N-acetylmuramic acid kinase n=1 Tax=Lewinella sp. JB7 TaxID=2962887 RepID=UPI0020C97CFA|nr:anhydro-N-acetylmuramic acid kinase [Lewinella sp. JB7]MCP9236099.1 anhydro-N-acetylmuramic acid kinase [Lewinella sp. JB7]